MNHGTDAPRTDYGSRATAPSTIIRLMVCLADPEELQRRGEGRLGRGVSGTGEHLPDTTRTQQDPTICATK